MEMTELFVPIYKNTKMCVVREINIPKFLCVTSSRLTNPWIPTLLLHLYSLLYSFVPATHWWTANR